MITLRKFATIALAMQDPAKTVSAQENSLALPDPHHTGVDTASYGNVMHTNPRLQSVPRRRLRQSSTLADKAAAPAPAMINEDTAPMIAPAPQSMTRVPGLVTKDKQFSVIDASCYKWTLPPGRYLEGEEASACCTTKTFAPYKEQIEVQNRDCCGVGTIKSTLVLSPGNSNSELPSQCCA